MLVPFQRKAFGFPFAFREYPETFPEALMPRAELAVPPSVPRLVLVVPDHKAATLVPEARE